MLFIIFGASGDLAKKKLIPAVFRLVRNKRLDNFAVVGISRTPYAPKELLARSKPFIEEDKAAYRLLEERFYYHPFDINDSKGWKSLRELLDKVQHKHKITNRIFYLATLPDHFESITRGIHESRLADHPGWSRVVYEKPFGSDLKSARDINRCIRSVFREDQIYRIDHYLGKELVQGISMLRFTNTMMEPIWNSRYIDQVQIMIGESATIEDRGNFYDKYGAVKDMVQNHLLQMLALVAMEQPKKLAGDFIRDRKAEVLKKVQIQQIVTGQYKGYLDERGVSRSSATETFAALKLEVSSKRWKGTPFYVMTGKAMKERKAQIYIQFKEPPCDIFEGICLTRPNILVIRIQPDEGFFMQINAKAPGKPQALPIKLDFCHRCSSGPAAPESYESLLLDVKRGDQSVFVRTDEIEEQWKIIGRINIPKPSVYEKGKFPEGGNLTNWYY